MRFTAPIVVVVILVFLTLTQTIYTVDQRKYAAVFQLGELIKIQGNPGLYTKIPFVQNVVMFDKRILTFDSPEAERVQTSEKKNVLVDSFVKWRIVDPGAYYRAMLGDEERAKDRLRKTVNGVLQEEFGKRSVQEVISSERDPLMQEARKRANQDALTFGVEIVDVRLKRVDLPQEVSEQVYLRMQSERKRVANELRSLGAAESERIRADADKQTQVILAEAYKQAQDVKGRGDAKAAAIYAAAYGKNPEFYAFYRSLEAYKASFKSKNDLLVVEPNAEFFKYLRSAGGNKAPSK